MSSPARALFVTALAVLGAAAHLQAASGRRGKTSASRDNDDLALFLDALQDSGLYPFLSGGGVLPVPGAGSGGFDRRYPHDSGGGGRRSRRRGGRRRRERRRRRDRRTRRRRDEGEGPDGGRERRDSDGERGGRRWPGGRNDGRRWDRGRRGTRNRRDARRRDGGRRGRGRGFPSFGFGGWGFPFGDGGGNGRFPFFGTGGRRGRFPFFRRGGRRGRFPFFGTGDGRKNRGKPGGGSRRRNRRPYGNNSGFPSVWPGDGKFPFFGTRGRRPSFWDNDGDGRFPFFRGWGRRGDRRRRRFPSFGGRFPFFGGGNGGRRRDSWGRRFPFFGSDGDREGRRRGRFPFFFGDGDDRRRRRRDRDRRDRDGEDGRDRNRDAPDRDRDDDRKKGSRPGFGFPWFGDRRFGHSFPGFSKGFPFGGDDAFGVSSNNGNTTFVGFKGDKENVCVERRNYTRRVDREPGNRRSTSTRCTATRGTRLCVATTVRNGVAYVEERISRCCPGTVPTDQGCKRAPIDKASEQIKQLKSFAFLNLLKKAGMQKILEDNCTLFVPTDAAVDSFIEEYPSITESSKDLRQFVGGHVVDDNLPLPLLTLKSPLDTRSGPLWVSRGFRGPLINCVPLLTHDRPTPSGGVIHTVNGVLLAHNRSLLQAIRGTPELSTLSQLLLETGLADEIANWTHITLFAPTNKAFRSIQLPENMQQKKADVHAPLQPSAANIHAWRCIDRRRQLPPQRVLTRPALPEILRGHVLSGLQCPLGLPGVGQNGRGRPVFLFGRSGGRVTLVPRLLRQAAVTVAVSTPGLLTRQGLLLPVRSVIRPPFARDTMHTLRRLRGTAPFAQLLTRAGLAAAANGNGVTLLVPPASLLANASVVPTDRKKLRSLLERHLLRGVALAERPSGPRLVRSLAGSALLVTGAGRRPLVQCRAVLGRLDLDKPTVAVLGVDGLVPPPAEADLLALLTAQPDLSNFARLVQWSGLSERLRSPPPLTLLAPVDATLDDISQLDTTAKANSFVRIHVLEGALCCGALRPYLTPYRRLDGGVVLAAGSAGGATFAPVGTFAAAAVASRSCDALATNGVLHRLKRPLEGPGADTDPLSADSALQPHLYLPTF